MPQPHPFDALVYAATFFFVAAFLATVLMTVGAFFDLFPFEGLGRKEGVFGFL